MNKENEKTENDIINKKLSDEIESEFLQLYTKMSANVSETQFEVILEILRNQNIKFCKETLESFRSYLIESLTENFKKMWQMQQLPQSISVLELLKKRYEHVKTPQWRPDNKSAYEQTAKNRIPFLKSKKRYLIKQLEFQKSQFESIVAEITVKRLEIINFMKKREVLCYQIDEDTEKLKALQTDIINRQLEVVELL